MGLGERKSHQLSDDGPTLEVLISKILNEKQIILSTSLQALVTFGASPSYPRNSAPEAWTHPGWIGGFSRLISEQLP